MSAMIRIYHTRGPGYWLAVRVMGWLRQRTFEGELISRKRRGEDIFDLDTRIAAAREALRSAKLPVLKQEELLADRLVEQEIMRLATAARSNK